MGPKHLRPESQSTYQRWYYDATARYFPTVAQKSDIAQPRSTFHRHSPESVPKRYSTVLSTHLVRTNIGILITSYEVRSRLRTNVGTSDLVCTYSTNVGTSDARARSPHAGNQRTVLGSSISRVRTPTYLPYPALADEPVR